MSQPLGVKVLLGLVILAVVSAVGFGIYQAGSPGQQRSIRFDRQRVSDLRDITYAIEEHWHSNDETLPISLDDLKDTRAHVRSINDPSTNEPYEYRTLDGPEYEICAVFETDSSQHMSGSSPSFSASVWEHGVGRNCFKREARKATDPAYP